MTIVAKADAEFSLDWVKEMLEQVVEKESRFALFCGNSSAQLSDNFKLAVSDLGGTV